MRLTSAGFCLLVCRLICGQPDYNVNDLKTSVEYRQGVSAADNSTKLLWAVLSEFNQKEKAQFLMFARGAGRLAREDRLTVSRLSKPNCDPDSLLPHSRTCFFELQVRSRRLLLPSLVCVSMLVRLVRR
jgi:hypothetical protein